MSRYLLVAAVALILVTCQEPPPPVAYVTVIPATASIPAGFGGRFRAAPRDADGNVLSRPVTWASSNTAVATVMPLVIYKDPGPQCQVAALAQGEATITATSENVTGTATVIVLTPVASVIVTPATATVRVGQTVQLTATTKDANGNVLTGRGVFWSSIAPAVATVNETGLVSAVGPGQATIVATSEADSGKATVSVQ